MDTKNGKIVPIFQYSSAHKHKDVSYMNRVMDLASQIRALGEQYQLDNGNVLMDVTYYTVAMDICDFEKEHRP